jgi:hypothetical protein
VSQLSNAGLQVAQSLAQRYGFSVDGVTHMMDAVYRGNGSMAQFSHPDFSGSGQWMSGGMTMVSDMFNQSLSGRVASLCSDIAKELANHQSGALIGSFQSQSQSGGHNQAQASGGIGVENTLFEPDPNLNWWPANLGIPNATGSQNNMRYAYFAQGHRLAVSTGGEPWVYDTLNHQIGGFSQQQGSDSSITFTSQFGNVRLSDLPVVSGPGHRSQPPLNQHSNQNSFESSNTFAPISNGPSNSGLTTGGSTDDDSRQGVVDLLERLGSLKEKGVITEEEFSNKKSELLGRL